MKKIEEDVRSFKEDVDVFEKGMWVEAKKYVDNGDMENLEKLVKESTRSIAELAYDLGVAEEQKAKLKTTIGVGSVVAGVLGFVLFKIGRWKSYQEIIDCYEEGNNYITVEDVKTRKMYEIKTECIGD